MVPFTETGKREVNGGSQELPSGCLKNEIPIKHASGDEKTAGYVSLKIIEKASL